MPLDRYMTASEFTDALADANCVVGRIEGDNLGTPRERIELIALRLSDGRVIEITMDTDLDGRPEMLLTELDEPERV